jgi:hypothetical protein
MSRLTDMPNYDNTAIRLQVSLPKLTVMEYLFVKEIMAPYVNGEQIII